MNMNPSDLHPSFIDIGPDKWWLGLVLSPFCYPPLSQCKCVLSVGKQQAM